MHLMRSRRVSRFSPVKENWVPLFHDFPNIFYRVFHYFN